MIVFYVVALAITVQTNAAHATCLQDIEGLPRLLEELLKQHKSSQKLLQRCKEAGDTESLI